VSCSLTRDSEIPFHLSADDSVSYNELLAESVRPLHEAIGRELENRPDRNAVSVKLAHDWWRAGDRERAARYAELAGDQSFAIGAFADAVVYYERALGERKEVDSGVPGLHHKIGLALGSLGRLKSGIGRPQRAGELYSEAGHFDSFARNASALSAQLYNLGDTAAAIDVIRQTIDALHGKAPKATLDLLRARMSYDCVAAFDFASAIALLNVTGDNYLGRRRGVTVEDEYRRTKVSKTLFGE